MRAEVGAAIVGVVLVAATVGAQPARAFPPDQVTRGEGVWKSVCAECHGPDSTNLDAPLLLHPDSLRRFPTAAAAHKYVSESMPSETPGSLTQEEYWDVLAFLLAQSSVGAGEAPLGPETAGAIPTRGQGGAGAPAPAVGAPAPPMSAPSTQGEGEGEPAP